MRAANKHESFEKYLLNMNILHDWQIEALGGKNERAKYTPEILQDLIISNGMLSDCAISKAIADFYGHSYIDLDNTTYDSRALNTVPASFAREHNIIPFIKFENELSVAMTSVDMNKIDAIQKKSGCAILPHIASREKIQEAIEREYWTFDINQIELLTDVSHILNSTDGSKIIIELADGIIANAIKHRASDVHIETRDTFLRVRFRIDGVLREEARLPKELRAPIFSRYKVMAELNVAESRKPQDGRFKFSLGPRSYDLRLSSTPTTFGEKMVLRILDKIGVALDLHEMTISEPISKRIEKVITSPSGVIFITGPTGSGKTTTCYAMLKYLNTMERNIVTIEDPIEYRLPLINQIQIKHSIGLDFPTVLRSVLRQDPDVILVGEIRDVETARIATQAALTGHLVLSTLHTSNAVQAVIRLVEMGVEPFMVAPTMIGVIAQQLVRKICPECKSEYIANQEELSHYKINKSQAEVILYRGEGCDACRESGYHGRMALHELVVITNEMKDLIARSATPTEIERCAVASGYKTMRYDGLKKALMGLTTLSEVIRVTPAST